MAKLQSKSVTKADLVNLIAENVGMTKIQSESFLNALAEIAYQEVSHGFNIPRIGKLTLVDRKARPGRNPSTGVPVWIPSRRSLKFKAAQSLRASIES